MKALANGGDARTVLGDGGVHEGILGDGIQTADCAARRLFAGEHAGRHGGQADERKVGGHRQMRCGHGAARHQ